MKLSELNEKLKKIKLLAMDVDGTLTDTSLYYSASGEELKRFSTRDGMGVTLLHRAGIETAIITSEMSPIVTARAKKLNIEKVILGCHDKSSAIKQLAESSGMELENIAFMGDDVNDYYALKIAGVSACPANAVDSIRSIVDYVCKNNGGDGAARELIELILLSQDKSIILTENW